MRSLIPFGRSDNSFFRVFDDMEKAVFGPTFSTDNQFRVDVIDKDDKFLLKAELPGFNKEDIKVDIGDEHLTISASHSEETTQEEDNYIRRERKFGSFARSFDLGGIDKDNISAAYKNGILEITLPKEVNEDISDTVRRLEIE